MENNKKPGKGEEEKVNLETILVNEIGVFGRYQKRSLALGSVYLIIFGWTFNEYIFTTARTNTRCLIRECDEPYPEFAPPWILNAVPGVSPSSFEQCERYANSSGGFNATCPATMFDQQIRQPCEEYVYENKKTVVYDFELACNDWKRSFIGTFRIFGWFCALYITGLVSDRWGRRVALAASTFNTAWIGLLRYWANSYWSFTSLEFVEAASGAGGQTCLDILLMELMGPNQRMKVTATLRSFYCIGAVLLGLIAWTVPDWRTLTLVVYLPQFLLLIIVWYLSESVRWLMCKNRYEESEKILSNMARVNKTTLSKKSLESLRRTNELELKKSEAEVSNQSKNQWLPVLLFRHKPVLIRCLVSPLWWFTAMLVNFGLSVNSVNMSGNRYINFMTVSAAQIPGYWTAVYFMDKFGRKPSLIIAFWICAACMVGYIFIPKDLYGFSLALYLIGKSSNSMVVGSLYTYTAEIYPTQYRHRLFAFSSMIGRLGSMIAPLTPALGDTLFAEFPFVLFAGFSLVAGGLVFITPETRGQRIPDTMEEADALGKKSSVKDQNHVLPSSS